MGCATRNCANSGGRQIDLVHKKQLTVGKSKTEAGTGRVIPLNDTVLAALLGLAIVVPLTSPTLKDADGNDTGVRKDKGDFANFRKRIPESAKQRIEGSNSNLCVGESIALTEQVRVMSVDRFPTSPFARLTPSAMAAIETGLAFVQGIPAPSTRMPLSPHAGIKPKAGLAPEAPKPFPGKPFDKG